ncbi:hypothetical protein GW17_00019245, partial [Ensete ventricosum]
GTAPGVEIDGKSSEGKERSPLKRSKGSLGSLNMIPGKNNSEPGKLPGQPANGAFSQRYKSTMHTPQFSVVHMWYGAYHLFQAHSPGNESGPGTEASQSGSQNGVTRTPSHAMLSHPMSMVPMPATAPGAVAGPTTNLNIGMDYWGAPSSSPIPMHGKIPATAVGGAAVPGAPSDIWLQEKLGEAKQGTKDQTLDRKEQHSGDGPSRNLDTEAQAAETEQVQSGV